MSDEYKERQLDIDDIRTYCRIVTALGITIEIQEQIDAVYDVVERETVRMEINHNQ